MIFSIFMFITIVFLGALGVDMMRFEMEHAKLQSTLDHAVLAAADMDQSLDPESLVNDYFTQSGLGGSVTGVTLTLTLTLTEGLGLRSVSATARKSGRRHHERPCRRDRGKARGCRGILGRAGYFRLNGQQQPHEPTVGATRTR